jgi:hypothetical protein
MNSKKRKIDSVKSAKPSSVRPSTTRTAKAKRQVSPSRTKITKREDIKRSRRNSMPLYKRFVLHPITFFTLLCVGVFISGWSYEALADSYTITAVVPAVVLSEGAVIASPTSGTTVTNASVLVSGTCPVGAYINIYNNNTFSGVTYCQNNGAFSMSVDLYSGENNIIAKDYNVTNQEGPQTPTVTVDYIPPVTTQPAGSNTTGSSATGSSSAASGSSTTTTTSTGSDITPGLASVGTTTNSLTPPLLLTSNYVYQTYPVASDYSSKVDVQGGTPPYYVTIEWGDGTSSKMTFDTDPIFTIKHHYATEGYYAIKVQAIDKTGGVRFIQLAARVVTPNATGNISTTNTDYSLPVVNQTSSTVLFKNSKNLLWVAWPSFIIVLAMVFSFWLGERQEVHMIYKRRTVNNGK